MTLRIPTAEERPTLRLEELCEPLDLSRSSVYKAAESGEIPTLRIGRRLLVPTAALRRMLKLDEHEGIGASEPLDAA